MRILLLLLLAACASPSSSTDTDENVLFDFDTSTAESAWEVEDDTVMGGRSAGHLEMTDAGHARFYGEVSLANDGGFSSIQHRFDPPADVADEEAFLIRLKGDGKDYTLRIQSEPGQRYAYQASFPTSGEWETVRVPFRDMSASWRGEPVDVPNFAGGPVQNVQLLIGNKKEQTFEVLVDRIAVE